ncbi:MAG: hypothetical protein LUG60_12955 [Erysipelotrichaceae bacterium]|nr:hypothetical protein [Erysipelotrichaceae bacterium]
MSKNNIIKTVKNAINQKVIDENYNMTYLQMKQIIKASKSTFDLCSYCFTYGYIQGMRAEESKKSLSD